MFPGPSRVDADVTWNMVGTPMFSAGFLGFPPCEGPSTVEMAMHNSMKEETLHATQNGLYLDENSQYVNEPGDVWLSQYEAEGVILRRPLKDEGHRFQSGQFPSAFQQGMHLDPFAPRPSAIPINDNDIPHSDSNLGDKILMRCPKDQVTSKKIRNASKERRKNPAKFKCPMEGCEGDFTRKHNLTSTFSYSHSN